MGKMGETCKNIIEKHVDSANIGFEHGLGPMLKHQKLVSAG
jgi:hypothetical protein